MPGNTVGERRKLRRGAQRLANDRGRRRGALELHHVADKVRDFLSAAGEHDANRVDESNTGAVDRLGWSGFEIEAGDELSEKCGDPFCVSSRPRSADTWLLRQRFRYGQERHGAAAQK